MTTILSSSANPISQVNYYYLKIFLYQIIYDTFRVVETLIGVCVCIKEKQKEGVRVRNSPSVPIVGYVSAIGGKNIIHSEAFRALS